jgi:predicted RNase H-like nuclease
MSFVSGVNGCRCGWLIIAKDTHTSREYLTITTTFADVVNLPHEPTLVCIDIPIGLLDTAVPGGRDADQVARRLLGRKASSVFPPPVRNALFGGTYAQVNKRNRDSSDHHLGISKQAFALFPKLREVDALMSARLQEKIFEIHPELCFFEMNGESPVLENKKTTVGQRKRMQLLKKVGFLQVEERCRAASKPYVAVDDILDAYAACWTAQRILNGNAIRIPGTPPFDGKGLRMEMWS